jgi:hypothetical protein
MDESYGILCLRISQDLLFHVNTCKTPSDVWTRLKDFLGKQDNLISHQLENDIHSLNPRCFETLHDYFCNFNKKDERLIFSILTKLGLEYFVYTSSFHTTRLDMGSTWKIPSIYDFMESIIHEKKNLIQIGELKSSKPNELKAQGSSKKNKQKNKGKKDQENKKEGKKIPHMRVRVLRHQKEIRRRQSVPTIIWGSILRVIA